ncbi:hypothetical protein IE077_000443, partial [Cardiosporidium cionae]
MDKLERLNLIFRVTTELNNHWGVTDRDLAEFIIHLGQESDCLDDFQLRVADNGAELSSSLAETLYKLIRKLSPAKSREIPIQERPFVTTASPTSPLETSKLPSSSTPNSLFPALTIPNSDKNRNELQLKRPDDTEILSSTAQSLLDAEKTDRELREEALKKEKEERESLRSNGRTRELKVEKVSEGRKSSISQRRPPLQLYSIYEGTINRVMDYGAFVSFNTAEGRKEGLVHASDISKPTQKILNISEALKRGQAIKVKVMAIAGSKVSLSMREVDQLSGEDLKQRTIKQESLNE